MHSVVELKLHQYLDKASRGLADMSDDTIEQVVSHIRDALKKQFSKEEENSEFRIRMSNIGKPYCQLWFQKNKPNERIHPPAKLVMNFMLGDIVEAVFKGLLRASGTEFEDNDNVTLKLSRASARPPVLANYLPCFRSWSTLLLVIFY